MGVEAKNDSRVEFNDLGEIEMQMEIIIYWTNDHLT
jgi:hypothetical protein